MSDFSWVTLATNDTYALGALVLAFSLKRTHTIHKITILATESISESMRNKLKSTFDKVIYVESLSSNDEDNLRLLNRPELGITFSKLHCWNLTQYKKCVYLDADILVLKNSDELFNYEEFSAAPDVGWPDCFNSGVFVFKPSNDTFKSLMHFSSTRTSFDGADQGLLNLYFSNWSRSDINKHLPFIYNTCSIAFYSYLPAFKEFRDKVKIIHFIGTNKPWTQYFDPKKCKVHPTKGVEYLADFFQLWWIVFCEYVLPDLDSSMNHIHYHHKSSSFEINRSPKQFDIDFNSNNCVFCTKINACNHQCDIIHNNSSKTTNCDANDSIEFEHNISGVASSLSQIKLEEDNAKNLKYLENLHRENWESGNIDYMGQDAFDNIWEKICSSLTSEGNSKF